MNGSKEEKASLSCVPYFIVILNNKKASPSHLLLPKGEKLKHQSNIKRKHNHSNIQRDSGPGSGIPDQVANYDYVMFASRDLLVQQVEEHQKNQGGNP